jgi:hypothetical protein
MQFSKTGKLSRSGLDDPSDHPKKRRKLQHQPELENSDDNEEPAAAQATDNPPIPKILPGERLSSFAARVDLALPVSGLKNKGNKALDRSIGVKGEKVTKLERKMHRMHSEWREEERRRKARLTEEEEVREEDEEWLEQREMAKSLQQGGGRRKKTRKGEKEEGDIWEAVKKARGEEGRQRGVMDVVQAPPKLGKVKEIFKAGDSDGSRAGVEVANVPSKAGSLRRREELGKTRENIVDEYRRLRRGG